MRNKSSKDDNKIDETCKTREKQYLPIHRHSTFLSQQICNIKPQGISKGQLWQVIRRPKTLVTIEMNNKYSSYPHTTLKTLKS